jgi:hypothetical protein
MRSPSPAFEMRASTAGSRCTRPPRRAGCTVRPTTEVAQHRFLCRYPHTSTNIRLHPIAYGLAVIGRNACVSGRSSSSAQSLHTREVAGSNPAAPITESPANRHLPGRRPSRPQDCRDPQSPLAARMLPNRRRSRGRRTRRHDKQGPAVLDLPSRYGGHPDLALRLKPYVGNPPSPRRVRRYTVGPARPTNPGIRSSLTGSACARSHPPPRSSTTSG